MELTRLLNYCKDNNIPFEQGAALADRCTFKIGGAADLLIIPETEAAIPGILRIAKEDGIPLFVLGKGSNVLFGDVGYRGAVLQLGRGLSQIRLLDGVTIDCGGGATLAQLCLFALDHSLSGLEFAYGIPGSVGGAISMNAGAYGGEIKDVLLSARHLCPDRGPGELTGSALGLSYRHSAYSDGNRIITGGVFQLEKGDKTAIRTKMDDFMNRRKTKQPLEFPSAGSTFKRPEGDYASALIDRCGLKGRSVGGAMVSEKHAGFVVNIGGATAADVRELIAAVQREVKNKTSYALECEIKIID